MPDLKPGDLISREAAVQIAKPYGSWPHPAARWECDRIQKALRALPAVTDLTRDAERRVVEAALAQREAVRRWRTLILSKDEDAYAEARNAYGKAAVAFNEAVAALAALKEARDDA